MKKSTKRAAKSKSKNKSASKSRAKKTNKNDLIELILEDHKPLKRLIKIMKNSDLIFEKRLAAFEEFCPLLTTHAKPEEEVMYTFMKKNEELREEGFEGDVEHQLADQMAEEAARTEDRDLFGARIKVLAELVEHHIEEEEEELLPDFRKATDLEQRIEMGNEFLDKKANLWAKGGDDSPLEGKIADEESEDEDESTRIGAVAY